MSTFNDDPSTRNNDNESSTTLRDNNFDSNNVDSVTNQKNNAIKNDDNERSEANHIPLQLNFDPTFADVEREKEFDEAQMFFSAGSAKKQLWTYNGTKVN